MRYDYVTRALLYICALGAGGGAIGILTDLSNSDALRALEVWRTVGLLFFASIFVLLGHQCIALKPLWLSTITSKILLVVLSAALLQGQYRQDILLVDGVLCVILILAFAASRMAYKTTTSANSQAMRSHT